MIECKKYDKAQSKKYYPKPKLFCARNSNTVKTTICAYSLPWQPICAKNYNLWNKMFYVYMLECADSTLYCGYTNNLADRLLTHNRGKGAKYTKCRLPVVLVYNEVFNTKSQALKRECEIKKLTRQQKLMLLKM